MVGVFPILFVGWKIIHKTRLYKPTEVDLLKDVDVIDEYQRNFIPVKETYVDAHSCHQHDVLTFVLGAGTLGFSISCSDEACFVRNREMTSDSVEVSHVLSIHELLLHAFIYSWPLAKG
jgi:hypothetical protein